MVYNSEEVKDPSFIILEDDALTKMVFKKSDGSTLVVPLADFGNAESIKNALIGDFAKTKVPGSQMTAADVFDLPIDLKSVYGISSSSSAEANTSGLNQAITDANAAYVLGLGIRKLKLPPEKGIRIKRSGVAGYAINGSKNGYELFGEGEGRTEFLIEEFDYDNPASFYQSIFSIKGSSPAEADLLKDIYLHDFSIDGNRDNMTGTPHANAGDTIDTKWCSPTVVVERVTVYNSSSDAFDIDDSNGAIVRFCNAYNSAGYGFHNSENCIGTFFLGNYAENCGHVLNRGGFDQFLTASKGIYVGNRAKDNYINFGISGSDASFWGNVDLGGAVLPNVLTGVSNGVDPVDGKLLLHSSTSGVRLSDQSDLAQNKRWLVYVTSSLLRFFSSNLAEDVLTLSNLGNLGMGSTATGGGRRVFALGNATVVPSANPTSGTLLYSEGGVLKTRSSTGVIASLVPPVPTVEVGEVEEAFRPTGFVFESVSRRRPDFLNVSPLQSSRLSLYAVYLPSGAELSSLAFYSSVTAAVSPTNQWFAIYDITSLSLIRQTVDDLTTPWAANTRKSLNLSSSWIVPVSSLYYIGIMVAASTVPSLIGVGSATAIHITGLSPIIAAAANGLLTTTAPSPAVITTPTTPIPYFTGS